MKPWFYALLASGMLACGKPSASAPAEPASPPSQAPAAVAAKAEADDPLAGVTRDFCIADVHLAVKAPSVPELTANKLLEPVRAAIAELDLVSALAGKASGKPDPGCITAADREHAVGVLVQVAVLILDGDGEPVEPSRLTGPGELQVSVFVHAERGGEGSAAEIGTSDLRAGVPLTPRHVPELVAFASRRLAGAVAMVAADALGQLAVRHAKDPVIRGLLKSATPWQRIGALREAGERGMTDALTAIHAAALDSRPDIAVVALATLGRLGQDKSVPTLVEALEARSVEVVDAALLALIDIGSADAKSAVEDTAKHHMSPFVRRRAGMLLRPAARRPVRP